MEAGLGVTICICAAIFQKALPHAFKAESWGFLLPLVPAGSTSEGRVFWKYQTPAVREMSEMGLVSMSENTPACLRRAGSMWQSWG